MSNGTSKTYGPGQRVLYQRDLKDHFCKQATLYSTALLKIQEACSGCKTVDADVVTEIINWAFVLAKLNEKPRMDLLPGLFEEIQTLVNRMEAKLMDYSNMHYDLQRMKELKSKIRKLKATEEFLEANLDLSEVEDPDEDKKALWSRVMDDDDDGFV